MHVLFRGDVAQRLRITSGLILFAFALTHFLNHALGLISIDTMHLAQEWRWVVTRSAPGTFLLLVALVTHMVLALYKLVRRTTLRMPAWELIQIGLGLLIPFLLLPHIVNTRIARVFFGVEDNYLYELARLWPASALLQSSLLMLVWIHGCMGIHYWLRLYAPYRVVQPVLLFFAIAVPLLSLGGFMVSGRAVALLIENPDMLARVKDVTRWPNAMASDALGSYRSMVRWSFASILALIALSIVWRSYVLSTLPKMSIKYNGGPLVKVPRGSTLLEISRMHRIPHASVCGGRARCSTCRVRVDDGATNLRPPTYPEAITLASIAAPKNVRLACQVRPEHSLTITRLLRPLSTGPQAVDLPEADAEGVEREMAVMFLNLREFTQMAEGRLPYDVVFILNEFFEATGAAIHSHGGWIDKFMGGGLLAIFGKQGGVEAGCRDALRAARAMDLALDHVNAKLMDDIRSPLRIGIGLHAGPLLLGRIGYGEAVDLTVIGNVVNAASRLEALSKAKSAQIVMSTAVAKHAGCLDAFGEAETVNVRGLSEPLQIVTVARGRDLPASILSSADDGERPAMQTA